MSLTLVQTCIWFPMTISCVRLGTNMNVTNLYQFNVFILNGKWCALLRLIPLKPHFCFKIIKYSDSPFNLRTYSSNLEYIPVRQSYSLVGQQYTRVGQNVRWFPLYVGQFHEWFGQYPWLTDILKPGSIWKDTQNCKVTSSTNLRLHSYLVR